MDGPEASSQDAARLKDEVSELTRRLVSRTATLRRSREREARLKASLSEATVNLELAQERLRCLDPPRFYVVGHAKSGTTWVMRLLDAHPEIMCKGEGRIFGQSYKRPDVMAMDAPTFQPSSLYRAVGDAEYLKSWIQRSVWSRNENFESQVRGLTREAIRFFMGTQLAKSQKHIVGDKTPFVSNETVSEIAEIDPEAKVIHVIRDGRDVAVSGMHHLWNRELDLGGQKDLTREEATMRDGYRADPRAFARTGKSVFTEERIRDMAETWAELVSGGQSQGTELLGESYLEIRYEDLAENPAKGLRPLMVFLGADDRRATVQRCVSAASFRRWTKGRRRGSEDSSSLLRKGVVGDWKSVFTDADRRIFNDAAGPLLIELGYEAGSDWV